VRFDGLLDRVREARWPYAITQDEPHPGNLLRTRAGLCLVEYDMTALVRPERDPCWVISSDPGSCTVLVPDWLDGPVRRAGAVSAALGLGRHSGIPARDPRPHQETADTLVSRTTLQEPWRQSQMG
jgi:hypothetical protein